MRAMMESMLVSCRTVAALFWIAHVSAQSSPAATVTFTLDLTILNEFNVLARASLGDNAGIASYGVVLTGPITSLDHNSPKSLAAQNTTTLAFGPAGFTSLRSADNVTPLLATQDTITPTPHTIYGFGQEANSFAALHLTNFDPSPKQVSWGVPLLIATGTYDSGAGRPGIDLEAFDTFAGVFGASGQPSTIAAVIELIVIPEPATLTLFGLACSITLGFHRPRGYRTFEQNRGRGSCRGNGEKHWEGEAPAEPNTVQKEDSKKKAQQELRPPTSRFVNVLLGETGSHALDLVEAIDNSWDTIPPRKGCAV